MKKIYIVLTILLALSTGCNYLDVNPERQGTLDEAFADRNTAEKFLYSCYSFIPQVQAMNGEPQTVGASDEAALAPAWDMGWHYVRWANLGQFNATNPIYNYWSHYTSPNSSRSAAYNLYGALRQCYTFLDRIYDVPDCPELFIQQVTAEAKFLIAYYHYILLRMYGPIVIIEGVVDYTAQDETFFPKRKPYDECVQWIADKLDEAAVELKKYEDQVQTIQTGRPTSIAAKGIKARMLLYAASPLFNGNSELYSDFTNKDGEHLINQTYDKEKWVKALEATKEAIDMAHSAGHSLYVHPDWADEREKAYNSCRYLAVTRQYENSELIWVYSKSASEFQSMTALRGLAANSTTVPYGGIAPSFKMVDAFYTEKGLPIDKDPDFDYAGRYDITDDGNGEKTVLGHLKREPRFYSTVAYDRATDYEYAGGKHTLYLRMGEVDPVTKLPVGNDPGRPMFTVNGYVLKKLLHPRTTFASNSTAGQQKYMMIFLRLGELYLNYAEAYYEYYGSLSGDGLEYLNRIRRRAGIPDVDDSWSGIAGKDYREIIRRERTIELMFEGHRYFDARRWKTAQAEFPVKQKSWNCSPSGFSTTNIQPAEDYLQLIDSPEPDKVFEKQHYLHPIDTRDININHNLVQNPGWKAE